MSSSPSTVITRNQAQRQQHKQIRYQQILEGISERDHRVHHFQPQDSNQEDNNRAIIIMGNKLSCSCTPLIKKAYKLEDTPFKPRREGRLWAEVFHVSAASGAVRWQQVSEDLVPVNIKCIQDQPELIFKITAYNSQVEKILDVTLRQPGTRLGQASECFVYWKDTSTGDTWGLNFTSPIDARQFRELCSQSSKQQLARKTSSSYSLRLNETSRGRGVTTGHTGQEVRKRKPQSTPSSPSKRGYTGGGQAGTGELQCTCMTAETLHKQRNGRVRYTASATLPKALRQDSSESRSTGPVTAYPSTTSVNASGQRVQRQTRSQLQSQQQSRSAQYNRIAQYAQSARQRSNQSRSFDSSLYHQQQQRSQQQQQRIQQQQQYAQQQQQQYRQQYPQQYKQQQQQYPSRSAGQLQQHSQQQPQSSVRAAAAAAVAHSAAIHAAQQQQQQQPSSAQSGPRSKSSDDVRRTVATGTEDLQFDPQQLKKMGYPSSDGRGKPGAGWAVNGHKGGDVRHPGWTVSPSNGAPGKEALRRHPRSGITCRPTSVPASVWGSCYSGEQLQYMPPCNTASTSTALASAPPASSSMSMTSCVDRSRLSRSEVGRRRSLERMNCFDYDASPTTEIMPRLPPTSASEPTQSVRGQVTPTPSSSGDETGQHQSRSRQRQQQQPQRSASPTIKVLQEYEQHLRNALAKGNDADTYSLNTFETILSQSMENVVALMKEVQSEIEAIRREESHYRSTADEAVFTHRTGRPQWARSYTLPSRGTSLPPPGSVLLGGSSTGDLYQICMRKQSAPLLDTLSVDGGGMHFLRPQSSFESTGSDSKAYLTSSEVSTRLSLCTSFEFLPETKDTKQSSCCPFAIFLL